MGAGDTACAKIAEKQSGLISRDQAIRTGMSERAIGRRLGAGRWHQVLPGVYRLAGALASWEQSLKGRRPPAPSPSPLKPCFDRSQDYLRLITREQIASMA